MKNTYLALAIGPIIKTLLIAESTRELWAASYTFSYLIKEIAHRFDEKYDKGQNRRWYKPALGSLARETFLPAAERRELMRDTGVGVFPDHLILDSPDENDVAKLRQIALKVIDEFAEKVQQELATAKDEKQRFVYDREAVRNYFRAYFQIAIVRKTLNFTEQAKGPIIAMTEVLNVVELRRTVPDAHSDVLKRYFGLRGPTTLSVDAFENASKEIRSIPEIALGSLIDHYDHLRKEIQWSIRQKDHDADHTLDIARNFVKTENERHPEQAISFLRGHKYIAIVQADGDGVGKFLQSLPEEEWGRFSEALGEFSAAAADLVERTAGGLPVYFGGDDALFFAPVLYHGTDVFTLCRTLDEKFRGYMKNFSSDLPTPTLSFGVAITYAKYPLYEALQHAIDLLLGPAKQGLKPISPTEEKPDSDKKPAPIKNNLAFSLVKGSGNLFGGLLHLGTEDSGILDEFLAVFSHFQKNDGNALRSIIYDLPANRVLYQSIAHDYDRLDNYLRNSFDEDVHRILFDPKEGTEEVRYMNVVARLIHKVYQNWKQYPNHEAYLKANETTDKASIVPNRMAYGLLKTILFLTAPEVRSELTPADV